MLLAIYQQTSVHFISTDTIWRKQTPKPHDAVSYSCGFPQQTVTIYEAIVISSIVEMIRYMLTMKQPGTLTNWWRHFFRDVLQSNAQPDFKGGN